MLIYSYNWLMDLWPRETSMQQASDNGVQLWTSGTKTSPLAWTDIDTSWSPSWESRNRCLYVYRQQLSLLSRYIYVTINFIAKFSRKLIAHCPIKSIFMKAFINLISEICWHSLQEPKEEQRHSDSSLEDKVLNQAPKELTEEKRRSARKRE